MPKEETIQIIKIKNVIGESNDLPSLNGRSSLSSLIKGITLRQSAIPESIHTYGITDVDGEILLDAAENFPSQIVNDGTYLYACISGVPGKLIVFDLKTFTRLTTITFDAGENNPNSVILHGSHIYVGLGTNPGMIVKIHKESLTKVSTLTLAAGETNINTLFAKGSYLYSGSDSGHLVRSNLITFLEVDNIPLVKRIMDITSDGNFIYAALLDVPGDISRISIDPFALVNTLTLNAGEDNPISLKISGTDLYVGLNGPTPPIVVKIAILTFTRISALTLVMSGATNLNRLYATGTYLIAATPGGFGSTIEIIDLSTFTEITTFDTGFPIWSIHFDETYIYSGMSNMPNPGRIARMYTIPTTDRFQRKIDLILEQIHTGTYYIIPSNAAPISLQSAAGAYNKGNYVEIIPVNSIGFTYYIVGIYINIQTAGVDYEIDVATGLAASEIIIATESASYSSANRSFDMIFPVPIKVAANTRISMRCSDAAGSNIVKVKLRYKD